MKIQYCSDLHLEILRGVESIEDISPEQYLTPGKAPYLALCGDICSPRKKTFTLFLEWCSKHWEKVFFLAGNAEYFFENTYIQPLPATARNDIMKDILSKFENIYFMDRSVVDLSDNIRVLGCTLWSDLSNNNISLDYYPYNDQNQIYMLIYKYQYQEITKLHNFEKKWLEDQLDIAKNEDKRCIVLTHHLPSFGLIPAKYEGLPMNFCVASSCDELLQQPVLGWISGNVHAPVQTTQNTVEFRINGLGFPKENVGNRNTEAILEI